MKYIKDAVDITYDFTSELPKYWKGFWERNDGLGYGGCDPDSKSKTLQEYHRILWTKHLPNGEKMILYPETDYGDNLILTWKNFRFRKMKKLKTQLLII